MTICSAQVTIYLTANNEGTQPLTHHMPIQMNIWWISLTDN